MTTAKQIGERLRTRREYLRMTQDDVATALHMTKGNYSRIESGQISISATDLCSAAETLRVDLRYFCDTVPETTIVDSDAARVWAAIPPFRRPIALSLLQTVKDTEEEAWIRAMGDRLK